MDFYKMINVNALQLILIAQVEKIEAGGKWDERQNENILVINFYGVYAFRK
jgi:hypothetical protein